MRMSKVHFERLARFAGNALDPTRVAINLVELRSLCRESNERFDSLRFEIAVYQAHVARLQEEHKQACKRVQELLKLRQEQLERERETSTRLRSSL